MIKNPFRTICLIGLVLLLGSFIKNNTEPSNSKKFIVVLDAGHGGHDPGNLGNGYLEKDIALSIVLKVGKILERNDDIQVIYTRKDDTFVDLFKRGEIANKANADLFVSVHCDSHNSNAFGAGTFVLGLHANKQNFEVAKKENSVIYLEDNYEQKYAEYDINSPESVIGLTIMQEEFLDQSVELAKLLQKNFTVKLKRKDRKVKQAGFIVLHQTFMPSVLVETGFLTNKDEGSYLNSSKGQQEMGTAIANAILSYKDGVDANLVPLEVTKTPTTTENRKKEETTSPTKTKPSERLAQNEKTEVKALEAPKKTDPVAEKKTEPLVEKKTEPAVVSKKEDLPTPKKEPLAKESVVFKVQILASSKLIPLEGANFKGLDQLSKERIPNKNIYRYMYGEANTLEGAKRLKANADAKGYTTSYIVAYKNGLRIPMAQALK